MTTGDTIAAISSAIEIGGKNHRPPKRFSHQLRSPNTSAANISPAPNKTLQTRMAVGDLIFPACVYSFLNPRSYTGEDLIEFHIPGNPTLAKLVLEEIFRLGPRPAEAGVVAKYDGFMPENMRPAVGMDINLPVRYARRSAAAREASERLQQRARIPRASGSSPVRGPVGARPCGPEPAGDPSVRGEDSSGGPAERRIGPGELYERQARLLAADRRQRQVYAQRDAYYQAIAEYHRRLAELERAVGGPLPQAM